MVRRAADWVFWRSFALVSVTLFVRVGAIAQAQPSWTVQDAVRLALENHPALSVETNRINTAGALVEQAGLRPNPRLFVQSENWNLLGNPTQPIASTFTDQFLYASQTLETGDKRLRRVELAAATVRVTEAERTVLAKQIEARVKYAYWAAAGAQRFVELLRESQQNLEQTIQYHEAQLQEGAIAEADVIRVRLEGDRTNVAVANAIREAANARIALQREMGVEAFADVRLIDSIDQQPEPPIVDLARAMEVRADVRQARQAVEQARAAQRLQRAIAKPDFEVLGGYKRTAGFNTVLWGVQVPLPFFNKNQGNIAAAESEIATAEARVRAVETRVKGEIEAAVRDIEDRRARLAGLVAETIQRADESVTIARAAYREGGTDLLRLLEAERIHIEVELMNARMRMEYRQSLVALETALGGGQ